MEEQLHNLLQPHLKGLLHVGYIVDDLEQALAEWQQLYGAAMTDIRRIPEVPENSPTLFALFTIAGQEFELIQPVAEPFLSLLNPSPKGGAGINHIAWCVNDIETLLSKLNNIGVQAGHVTPDGVVNFGHKKILYLDPATTNGQLIELVEITEGL